MLAANRLFRSRCLLEATGKQFLRQFNVPSTKGFWPEPISQQTLEQFLDDIDYFEQPKKFINIGLRLEQSKTGDAIQPGEGETKPARSDGLQRVESVNVDQLLDMLGQDIDLPELDLEDTSVGRDQLRNLAITHGIYRDLFGDYKPPREQISFTTDQAERLSKLVPHYWISDQPHARADRHLGRTEPLVFFEPLVRISARFVHSVEGEDSQYAHTAHHGNIIPASEALIRPSITLDCRDLPQMSQTHSIEKLTADSQFTNWTPGLVTYSANLHWMVTNMKLSSDGSKNMAYEEICEFLPVHGIRGFGYSRYVFLVLQHDGKIQAKNCSLSPESRAFDTRHFISRNRDINITPVGLSWFQTKWDESSNRIFHEHLKMRSPVYEHVQEKFEKREMLDKAYPGRIPFNLFMDHYRDKKETNEKILLERLKTVDPFDYKDQYVPPRVPPTVFVDEDIPSWMSSVMLRKKNKIGHFRGLRPASVTIPLNNNADLDHPIRPLSSSKKTLPGYHNQYEGRHVTKKLKDLPYSKPANEHQAVYIQDDHEKHMETVKKMMSDLKKEGHNK